MPSMRASPPAFAATVCESFLTSPGAGGFMLVHRARDRSTRLADFFVAAPGLGLSRRRGGPMQMVDVGFGDSATTQPFLIGPASVAVPGAAAGSRGGAPALREPAVAGAPRTGRRARAARRRGHTGPGPPPRDPRPDHSGDRRGPQGLQHRSRRRGSSPATRSVFPTWPRRFEAVAAPGERRTHRGAHGRERSSPPFAKVAAS